ncbi:MAG: hypothetical protein ACR2FF_09650 [Mycobacteriales bacterium]|nr:MAG: hypothetical protein DLM56_00390 [Pseudonocardiales bacterium]
MARDERTRPARRWAHGLDTGDGGDARDGFDDAASGRDRGSGEDRRRPLDVLAEARRMRLRLGAAIVVLLLAVGAAGYYAGGRPVAPGTGVYNAKTTNAVTAALPLLEAFVERIRGQAFERPVRVEVVSGGVLARQRVAALSVPTADRAATARALHLGKPATPSLPAGTSADAGGYYSFRTRVVYLASGPFDAYRRAVLVHELTHALDDQRFDLRALSRAAAPNADRLRAVQALIEGDAARVEHTFTDGLSAADQATITAHQPPNATATTLAGNEAGFVASPGQQFVLTVAQRGGEAAVDAAFLRPPDSSLQILLPQNYVSGVSALGVIAPTPSGTTVDQGSLGTFGLATFLTDGRSYLNASTTTHWQGDSYRTVTTGAKTCITDDVLLSSGPARDQLVTALRTTIGKRGHVAATPPDDALTFTSCSS